MLSTVPIEGEEPLAKWITRRADDKTTTFSTPAPSAAHPTLPTACGGIAAGAVLTSATLQSLGSFNLILRQTGLLWLPETTTLALESPFNFDAQGELYIPPVQASPKDPDAHTAAIVEWLPKLVSLVGHRYAGVVFLAQANAGCRPRLPDEYLPLLLVQGELPKAVLYKGTIKLLPKVKPALFSASTVLPKARPARYGLRAVIIAVAVCDAGQSHRENPKPLD